MYTCIYIQMHPYISTSNICTNNVSAMHTRLSAECTQTILPISHDTQTSNVFYKTGTSITAHTIQIRLDGSFRNHASLQPITPTLPRTNKAVLNKQVVFKYLYRNSFGTTKLLPA